MVEASIAVLCSFGVPVAELGLYIEIHMRRRSCTRRGSLGKAVPAEGHKLLDAPGEVTAQAKPVFSLR